MILARRRHPDGIASCFPPPGAPDLPMPTYRGDSIRMLWFIPITMVPQWFMGRLTPGFGPDTSIGIIPQPHVFLYYMIFFGFGALYYDSDDRCFPS